MLDFLRLAADHQLPVATEGHHHCHHGWVQTHCPSCAAGLGGYHLGFSLESGNFNCWRCGPMRRADVLGALLRLPPDTVRQVVARYSTPSRPTQKKTTRERGDVAKPPPQLGDLCARHRQYLRSRGLCVKRLVRIWGLKGTQHLSASWSWRIVAPICTREGVTAAYVGRSIRDSVRPKYRLSDGSPPDLLYGIHRVPGDSVIVVEGPADVWAVGPGAVATLGIDWHTAQALQLKAFRRRYIAYDPEERAQKKAQELGEWLSLFSGETTLIEGLPGDPGSLSRRRLRELRGLLEE